LGVENLDEENNRIERKFDTFIGIKEEEINENSKYSRA